MFSLLDLVSRTLGEAYFYAEFDIRKKAKAIADHFDDPRLDIGKLVEAFQVSSDAVHTRLEKSVLFASLTDIPLNTWYFNYFLREVGLNSLGAKAVERRYGDPPDEYLEQITSETGGYKPRNYYLKEEEPPTVISLLDDFADAIVDAAKA